MRAIVLIKQVPDLRLGGVGVRADGTIDRSAAAPITNPADMHAVEAAVQLADDVCALSMGPPAADEALRQALAAGANRAVLLCDHALAGSDTWATANALSAAIEWIGGADLVLCGISAIDGETGQVGPSVAQRLGWPQATGCESLAVDGKTLIARRVVEGGFERLRLPLPAVVTVGETGFAPRYPTLPGRRRAATTVIEHVTAGDVGVGASKVGLAASPTKVARMTPSPWPDRGCRYVDGAEFGYDDLVSELIDRGAFIAGEQVDADGVATESVEEHLESTGHEGDASVWVVCQMADGTLDRASVELLSKATTLAPALGGGVGAVVLAANSGAAVEAAGRHGADVVYVAEDPALADYRAEPFARVIVECSRGESAECGSVRRDHHRTRPCSSDRIDARHRPGGGLHRSLCRFVDTPRPHLRRVAAHGAPGDGRRRAGHVPVSRGASADGYGSARRVRRVEFAASATRRTPRRLVVRDRSARRGPRAPDQQRRRRPARCRCGHRRGRRLRCRRMAPRRRPGPGNRRAYRRLAGAVEAGLAERAQQVGQTGATVHPRLYVACGISGALQHAVGMQDSATIVAINRDPKAVIFRLAHFGIVADVGDAVPEFVGALRRRRSSAG